jgi:hypothetical protein
VAEFEGVARERLQRVLVFLAISGGAAVVSKRTRSIVARDGDVDDSVARAAVDVELDTADSVVRLPPDGLVCDVGERYRLIVRVAADLAADAGFVTRMRRARQVLERFVVPFARSPASTPPGAAPAHAVVYAPELQRRKK